LQVRQGNHQPGGGGRQGKPARPETRKPSGALAGVRFLPLQVAEECGAEAGRGIEIVLGGQRVLRIPPGFDRQTLADVLAVLEARPC
jgi:antitoxin component of MazEF toxin-antitoxin module